MATRIPRRPEPHAADAEPLGWDDFYDRFAGLYRQGEHVTILGPPGTGKTVLARELLELRESVIALAIKPRDKIVESFAGYGYRVQESLDVPTVEDRGGGRVAHPDYRRIVLWPRSQRTEKGAWRSVEQLTVYQRQKVRAALDYARRTGNWTLFADDANTLTDAKPPALNLGAQLTWIWRNGRSQGTSLVMAGQRPSWVPREAYSSASHLFFFATRDRNDLERLADIGAGIDPRGLEHMISNLRRHTFLYVAPREFPPVMYVSKVELERSRT